MDLLHAALGLSVQYWPSVCIKAFTCNLFFDKELVRVHVCGDGDAFESGV